MSNKIIVKNALQHYYDEGPSSVFNPDPIIEEPDKSKSISELSQKELFAMLQRVRNERELQQVIRDMKRSAGERDTYEDPVKVDVTTPINKLYHHGITGMRWGVRRFQNEDGTRTPKGKKRERDIAKSDDHLQSRASKSKSPAGLSNDELRKLNERLQMEDVYKRLTADKMAKSESWVKTAIREAGQAAVKDFAKGVFTGGAKLLVQEMSPQFAEVAFPNQKKKSS